MDSIEHPVFGSLTWNDELQLWQGQCPFGSSSIGLWIHSNAYLEVPPSVNREIDSTCAEMFAIAHDRLDEYLTQAIIFVQTELSHWFDAKEELLTASLRHHMRIETLEIRPEHDASVWFHGPDTIYESGHAIELNINNDGSVRRCNLQG